jgi:hypothetical protein
MASAHRRLACLFHVPGMLHNFGTQVPPPGHRAVSVVLAVAYFGFVIFAVLRLGGLSNTTVYGWVNLLVSLFSSVSSIASFYGRKEPDEDENPSF